MLLPVTNVDGDSLSRPDKHIIRLTGNAYDKFLKFQLKLQVKLNKKLNQSETIDYLLSEHATFKVELKKLQKKTRKK